MAGQAVARGAQKALGRAFFQALKKGTGWRYAGEAMFRADGDWFVSVCPMLLHGGGVAARWTVKPMAIDPLFWEIVGFEENKKRPLSFRETGAWTLRPRAAKKLILRGEPEPERLAAETLEWAERRRVRLIPRYSTQAMLEAIGDLDATKGAARALAVCLLLLRDDPTEAERLCRAVPQTGLLPEDGGFILSLGSAGADTFYDRALRWIERRGGV